MWSGVCTDTVVTQSRNVMTTDWVYATGYDYWIQDYTHTTSTFETRQHVILDSEKEDFLHYCFIDPPVEPVMLETYKLADTGSDMPWYLAGIALCISVIGFTMVFGVKKVKK